MQAQGAGQDQKDIDEQQPAHRLAQAGQELGGSVRGFGAEQLHPADLEERQDDDRHGDDADAAQPLQQGTPQQDAGRGPVEADDDRGAGGREAGDALEDRIRE